jgi:hypothetical protein
MSETEVDLHPYSTFIFAMNTAQTRQKYSSRLDRFFRFIDVKGKTIEQWCDNFYEAANADEKWALNNILKFLQHYKVKTNGARRSYC